MTAKDDEFETAAPVMQYFKYDSPNFDKRNPAIQLNYIVIHYTGMPTRDAALKRMGNLQSEVSAHYLIDTEGRVFQLVDESNRAWHAGKSSWRGVADVNSASIGIELVNPGHVHGYVPFPGTQIAALKHLLKDIIQRHGMNAATALLGHSDVAPTRKIDPGELFPWQELAKEGLGRWPQPEKQDYDPLRENEDQTLLRTLGYDCPRAEFYTPTTRAALIAFQRRYHPDNVTGTPEVETIARLRALARIST